MATALTDAAFVPARDGARRSATGVAATVWLSAAAVAALVLALRLPVATTVLGLVAFGVLHNVLELRYVAGRYQSILTGRFLVLLVALVTGVALCRLLPPSAGSRAAEIVLCYTVLGAACVRALWHRLAWLGLCVVGLLAAAGVSLAFPAYHFVVLTHLHNIVPLFFLWEWSRVMPAGTRTAFRFVNVGWVVAVPALILAGVFDDLLRAAPTFLGGFGGVPSFDPARLVPTYAPPAMTDIGLRFLAVFAFMQTMHYVVWVGILPRYAPEAAARFDLRVPVLRAGRAWLLGGGLALVLGVVFAIDYWTGKALYASAASYHAYLEFPVLLALILARGPRTAPTT